MCRETKAVLVNNNNNNNNHNNSYLNTIKNYSGTNVVVYLKVKT